MPRNNISAEFETRLAHAAAIVRGVGHIIALFPSVIRAINSAPAILKTEDPQSINSFAVNSAHNLVNLSPTILSAFQLAASEFHPKTFQELSSRGDFKTRDLLNLMSAREIAAVLGITYFYKLLKKSADNSELARIDPLISLFLKNGALAGAQLAQSFGNGGGLTACGLRMLGLACLIRANPKGFKLVRRQIDDAGTLNNHEIELANFKCTHLDIASVLAGELGYGHSAREAFLIIQSEEGYTNNPIKALWQQALVDSYKLWKTSLPSGASKKKNALGTHATTDGYKWLWSNLLAEGAEDKADQVLPEGQRVRADRTLSSADLRIMIIEDMVESNRILEKMVSSLGHISCFLNAEEAEKQILNGIPYDLIFLDVGLPGKSGLAFLKQLREQEIKLNIPEENSPVILMLTGDESAETVVKAFSDGADGYLTKPFNRDEISAELEKYGIHL